MIAGIGRAGLGITGLTSSSSAWTPAKLFANGEVGFWFDFSDMSLLFQDSAGTVPVTAVGQTVMLVKDKSGNGFNCTASGTQCPTYNGSLGLLFDGSDDCLTTPSSIFYGASGAMTAFASIKASAITTGTYSILDDDDGTQRTSQLLRLVSNGANTIWFTNGSNAQIQANYTPTALTKVGAVYIPGSQNTIMADGASGRVKTTSGTFTTLTASSVSKTIMIGKRKSGTQPYKGTIQSLVMVNSGSTDILTNLMDYY